ncbi:hypothetical protein PENSPDRAFT_686607 [Peniophora sp. CONT]|nr:hypothetical protein PENSPDRAFT_686607 [Peniophora sp. CONT]
MEPHLEASSTATPEPEDTAPPLAARLPPAILSRVFELLHDDSKRETSLEWIKTSHVCRHWRTQALGHKLLWASLNPVILSRGLLDVFLERSEGVPLAVFVDVISDCDDWTIRQAYKMVLTTQLHRVRSLAYAPSVAPWPVPTAEELVPLLKQPAPLLQALLLPGFKRSKFLYREARTLLTFLLEHAPNIQELELTQFPPQCFPWGSPPAAMRTLVLSADSSVEGTSTLTFSLLLEGLGAMPALQTLSLSGVIPKDVSGTHVHDIVHLPHLQKLRLSGSGEQYARLWYHLKTHRECAVRIEIVRSPTFPAILPAALARHYAECDVSSSDELFVKRNTAYGLAYDLYPIGQPPDECTPPSHPYTHPSVSLFVAWENRKEAAPELPAVQIFAATPISNIKILAVAAVDAERIEPERFIAFGPLVGAIEDLTLVAYRPSQLSSMFLILGGTLSPGSSHEGDKVPMPHLRSITLKQCRFDRDIAGPTLLDVLERRAQFGVMLNVLSFVDCGLDPGRAEELEVDFVKSGLIQCIRCDGDSVGVSPV